MRLGARTLHAARHRCAPALLLLALAACDGDDEGPTSGSRTVAFVRLTTSTTAIAVGRAATLSVEALSANGSAVGAGTPSWSIAPTGLASFVGTPGTTATIRGDATGTVTVRATVQGLFGDATIEVGPATVARVEVEAPAGIVVGQSVQLVAKVFDGNDGVLTDRPVRWSTSDPSLVRIDSITGLATALGVGSALMRARSEGVSGTVALPISAAP
jgi:hypothetical protein